LEAVRIFENRHREVPADERREAVSRFIARTKSQGEDEERAAALAGLAGMARSVCNGQLHLEADEQYRILERYRTLTNVMGDDAEEFLRHLDWAHSGDHEHSFLSPEGLSGFRMAFSHLKDLSTRIDTARLVRLAEATEADLRKNSNTAKWS
jgi:hypothetical protein